MTSLQYPDSPGGVGTPNGWANFATTDVINQANGFSSYQWTNGVRIFQTAWRSNSEARIVSIGNLYPNTQFNTYATGRLLVKA